MGRTIHLGYTCPQCWTRVPVYDFTNVNGETVATPPVDQTVECPHCHLPRTVKFAQLERLERWERQAEGLPRNPVLEPASRLGSGAKLPRQFTRTTCGPQKAQLVKGTNGCVYVVSPDGTTVIFRDESAKQLTQTYSESNGEGKDWDFCLRLIFQIAPPVANSPGEKPPQRDTSTGSENAAIVA
jgi:hypothetical protein